MMKSLRLLRNLGLAPVIVIATSAGCGDDAAVVGEPDEPSHRCPPEGYEWTLQGSSFACVDVHLPAILPVSVEDIDTTTAADAFTNRCEPNWPATPDLVYHFTAPAAGTYEVSASTAETTPESHAVWFVTGDCDDYVNLGRMGLVSFSLSFDYEMAAGEHVLVVFEGGKGHSLSIRAR
jgi:hypothetical protein